MFPPGVPTGPRIDNSLRQWASEERREGTEYAPRKHSKRYSAIKLTKWVDRESNSSVSLLSVLNRSFWLAPGLPAITASDNNCFYFFNSVYPSIVVYLTDACRVSPLPDSLLPLPLLLHVIRALAATLNTPVKLIHYGKSCCLPPYCA